MMKGISILVLGAVVAGMGTTATLVAQGGGGRVNSRLASGQPAKFVQGLCPLRLGNKKLETGYNSLKKAYDAKTPAERSTLLTDARTNLVSAITTEGQGTNGGAWYYLARTALMRGDPVEADSAFTKAQELVPQCEIDISTHRQNSWAVLGKAGIEMQQAGQSDSALAQFYDANYLFRELPHVFSNMGVIFANTGKSDSAAAYFAKALELAESDSTLVEERDNAAQNLALMQIRTEKFADAIKTLQKSRRWYAQSIQLKQARVDSLQKVLPKNAAVGPEIETLKKEITKAQTDLTDTEKTLALTFRNQGMTDSANAMEHAVVDKFSAMNLDSLETSDLLTVGVAHFNSGRYPQAKAAFAKAAERNGWSRDARYNLAITYLGESRKVRDSSEALKKLARSTRTPSAALKAQIADTVKFDAEAAEAYRGLVKEATRLTEIDPMNEDALRLLAQAQRGLKQDQDAYKTAERLVGLAFSVEITGFQMGSTRARLIAEATGRNPMDADGKPIKPAAKTLVVEFLNSKGEVVDTKEVAVPVLTNGQKHPIDLEGKGADLVAWRYRPRA
jgi:tetratricopeptide (TPR) repeat protein